MSLETSDERRATSDSKRAGSVESVDRRTAPTRQPRRWRGVRGCANARNLALATELESLVDQREAQALGGARSRDIAECYAAKPGALLREFGAEHALARLTSAELARTVASAVGTRRDKGSAAREI